MNNFIFLTPVYWDALTQTHVNGKYKIAMNVSYIRQFIQTDYGYSFVTMTDTPLGSESFHKFRESTGEIMELIRGGSIE